MNEPVQSSLILFVGCKRMLFSVSSAPITRRSTAMMTLPLAWCFSPIVRRLGGHWLDSGQGGYLVDDF